MTSENPPTLNEPREEITDGIKGRPTAQTITPDQLAELHADLDRYEEVQGDMNEQAIDSARAIAHFEMQLGRLRDQLAILAGNRPTPEQLRGEHGADTAMARRIHQARPGIPVHHVLATLEVLRAVQEMEPTEPAPASPDLTVQQSDALWDAVAIPGPETPTFVKQHERVCEVIAEMLHQATAPREEITQPDESGPAATEATDLKTTARVFAGLHQSAEQDVTRVIALYEQWVKAGAPPLGVSTARWWDARLVELHNAILPPADQPKE